MTKAERERYRNLLLELRARLRGDVEGVRSEALRQVGGEASGSLSNAPLHTADLGTDTFEQEVALGLMEKGQQILAQIGPALDRIDAGTYGTCLECGQPIAPERLQALPYTPHCIDCARKFQEETGQPTAPAGNL